MHDAVTEAFAREWATRHSDEKAHPPNFPDAVAFVEASKEAGEAIVTIGPAVACELLLAMEWAVAIGGELPPHIGPFVRTEFLEELRKRFDESGPNGRLIASVMRDSGTEIARTLRRLGLRSL